jgi:hypothetical protein
METRSITEICNFRRAPVVGVPIAKVANTLVSWLCWMAGSYVGHLDTKTISLRSLCLKYPGLTIPRYIYGPANLVGRLKWVTFRGRCALVSPTSLLWTPKISRRNEGHSVGCAPNGPTKCFRVLGCYRLETLRSACLGWLCQTLCSYARYLDVSTLHTFKTDVISPASSSTG